jgi:isopentenyl-diphosphate delta-isomerase
MIDEEIEVVDADNNVLYAATKAEAHKKGLLHRTVIAELRDPHGNITLVKQAPDRQDAGRYVSPVGGHVKAGESEIKALERETLEEIGLQDFEYKPIGRFIYRRAVLVRDENHYFFAFEIILNGPIVLGDEAVAYKTFTEDALKKELRDHPADFGPTFYIVLRHFYPHLLDR